jgi:hypothetical protein
MAASSREEFGLLREGAARARRAALVRRQGRSWDYRECCRAVPLRIVACGDAEERARADRGAPD